jgi:hypothetical protein
VNAYPLLHKNRVAAWACGICNHPAAGWTHSTGWVERDVENSREMAAKCCRCECGRQVPSAGAAYCEDPTCVADRAARAEAVRAKWAAQERTDCDSFEEAITNHDYAWRFELQGGRQGIVYVGGAWSGTFHSAYARLDPTEYDPEPMVHCETLQRSEQGSVWSALAALCLARVSYSLHETPITHLVLCPDGAARGKDPTLVKVDALELVSRSEGAMRAEIAAVLRGEFPRTSEYLPVLNSDEARAARAVVEERDELRALVKSQDEVNAGLRQQVLDLQAALRQRAPSTA